MRVERIWIQKKGKVEDVELVFKKPINKHYGDLLNISVIVGENGTGKTTMLRFLSQVFNPQRFKRELPREYSVSYELDTGRETVTGLNRDGNGLPRRIVVSTCSPFVQYPMIRSQRNLQVPYSLIGAGGAISKLTTVYLPMIEAYYQHDRKKAKAFGYLLNLLGYSESPFIEINTRIIRKLGDRGTDGEIERTAFELLQHYGSFGSTEVTEEDDLVKGVNINTLDSYPGGIKKWINDVAYLKKFGLSLITSLWLPKGPNLINISNLSSGELSLFFRFFSLIKLIEDDSLILIDEPETHLHPKWAQKFMHMLKEIFKSFKVHIIIATHSPFIVYEVPRECIISLAYNKAGKIVQEQINERTLGSAPMDVFQEVFQIEKYTGKLTEKVCEEIVRLIEIDDLEKAELLYNDLGNSSRKYSLFLQLEEARRARRN